MQQRCFQRHMPKGVRIAVILAFMHMAGGAAFAATAAPQGLSLYDALAHAYQKNPDLEAVRAELRGIDEGYAQATAGFRPSVNATADYTSTHKRYTGGTSNSDPKTVALEVTQSIYSGGATSAAADESYSKIKAGRAKLKITEQDVLLDGVSAYMNLIRDQDILQLNISNERVLESHLKASNERFRLGDITKTDVSQAESRLAGARASRIAAEGELKKSRAAFERVIGLVPENLRKPELKVNLPGTVDEALNQAARSNPSLILAKYTEAAAKASTRAIEGERLPQLDLTGSLGKVYDPALVSASDQDTRAIGLRATLPLYTGGSTMSRIRQSRQTENQLRMQTRSAERTVRETVIQAWESLAAATAESQALQAQINAARLALDGVKVEADYGSRTTLDLLDAEQEYLNAQVAYVGAEADRIVASYGLLSAIGGLTAEGLQLNVPVYKPVINFQN